MHFQEAGDSTVTPNLWALLSYRTIRPIWSDHIWALQWQSWEAMIKAPGCSKNPHCWCEDFLMCPLLGCLSFLPLLLFPSHSDIIEFLLLGLIFLGLHHVHGFLSLLLVDFFISSLSAFLPEFTLFLMEFLLWFSSLSSHSLCSSTIPQL